MLRLQGSEPCKPADPKRPATLDDFGLDSGLRWLCERFTQRTQIQVVYSSDYKERMAESLETHLFRITQEALTNVARHSGASMVRVCLEQKDGEVHLTIEDNGKGLRIHAVAPLQQQGTVSAEQEGPSFVG